jgi:hypothetical protein
LKLGVTTAEKVRKVIELLKQHPITEPIHADAAGTALGMSESDFRDLARDLTIKGIEISSDTKRGFWWAYEPEDMLPKINHLESRTKGLFAHLKGAKMAMRRLERNRAVPRNKTYQLDLEYQNVQNQ